MSMIRDPLLRSLNNGHNLLPQAGGGIWLPLHNSSFQPGVPNLPIVVETVAAGSASGSKWATPGMYRFPDDNGTTNEVILQCQDDEGDLFLDQVLTLVGAPAQLMICMQASYDAVPSGNSNLFCYGRNNAAEAAFYGLDITSAEAVRFARLGKGGSAASTATLSAGTGTFASLRGNGVFNLVLGIRFTAASTASLELQASNGTQSCTYSSSGLDMLPNGATALSGFDPSFLMADFVGLALGGRNGSSGPDANWGNGSGNTAEIGNFQARRYATYSSTRVADKLAKMLTRPRDYVLED